MKICSLSSGSKGNSVFLETDKSKILIDAGHSGKQIEILMNLIGESAGDLDAIFVTHEHMDHIKGVGVLSRRYDLPILANEKTWLAMRKTIGNIEPKNIFVFKSNTFFSFRDVDVHAFSTHHDAADPVAYVFYQDRQKITVLTDTGVVTQDMKDNIMDSNIYYIEANHDIDMLKNGPYPRYLKDRILSNHGHISNEVSKDVLADLVKAREEKIILAHLSDENNLDQLAYETVDSNLSGLGIDTAKDIEIVTAPKLRPSKIFDIGGNYTK